MIWVYRLLFLPAFLLLFPRHWSKAQRRGGFREKWRERLGIYQLPGDFPALNSPRPRIWLQAVSVGEILAIEPLLDRLCDHPAQPVIILTTTTTTGLATARARYADKVDFIGFFPADFYFCQQKAFRTFCPDLLILTESELWPEFLQRARAWAKPVVLVNARLSDRSYRRLLRFRSLLKPLLKPLTRVLASSKDNAARFADILPANTPVEVSGNLKYDFAVAVPPAGSERMQALANLGFRISNEEPAPLILLGSSTWPGEELMLLQVFEALRPELPQLRLLLVPRHAERRKELEQKLSFSSYKMHFRSSPGPLSPVDILVADTTGELRQLTALADLAFIGKSLPPHHGGQTPVEAAALGLPMVCGPHMENFRDAVNGLSNVGALRMVATETAARDALTSLLRDAAARSEMSAAAFAWHRANTGATDRTLAVLTNLLQR